MHASSTLDLMVRSATRIALAAQKAAPLEQPAWSTEPAWRRDLRSTLRLDESDLDRSADVAVDGGWRRLGLSVRGRFEDDAWLDAGGAAGWRVAYHGTDAGPNAIRSIVQTGLRGGGLGSNGDPARPRSGDTFGRGIYVTPSLNMGVMYASRGGRGFVRTERGCSVLCVFCCAVRPGGFSVHEHKGGEVWTIGTEADCRATGIWSRSFSEDEQAFMRGSGKGPRRQQVR